MPGDCSGRCRSSKVYQQIHPVIIFAQALQPRPFIHTHPHEGDSPYHHSRQMARVDDTSCLTVSHESASVEVDSRPEIDAEFCIAHKDATENVDVDSERRPKKSATLCGTGRESCRDASARRINGGDIKQNLLNQRLFNLIS